MAIFADDHAVLAHGDDDVGGGEAVEEGFTDFFYGEFVVVVKVDVCKGKGFVAVWGDKVEALEGEVVAGFGVYG